MLLRVVIGVLAGGVIGAALGYYGQCPSGTCPLTSTWWTGAIFGAAVGLAASVWSKFGGCSCGSCGSPGPDDELTKR